MASYQKVYEKSKGETKGAYERDVVTCNTLWEHNANLHLVYNQWYGVSEVDHKKRIFTLRLASHVDVFDGSDTALEVLREAEGLLNVIDYNARITNIDTIAGKCDLFILRRNEKRLTLREMRDQRLRSEREKATKVTKTVISIGGAEARR